MRLAQSGRRPIVRRCGVDGYNAACGPNRVGEHDGSVSLSAPDLEHSVPGEGRPELHEDHSVSQLGFARVGSEASQFVKAGIGLTFGR